MFRCFLAWDKVQQELDEAKKSGDPNPKIVYYQETEPNPKLRGNKGKP